MYWLAGWLNIILAVHVFACVLQGSCSVGISLDHRSTKTGAPDDERSLTVRKLANLYQEVDGGGGREEGQLMGAREWMVWVRGCAHGGGGVPMGERV